MLTRQISLYDVDSISPNPRKALIELKLPSKANSDVKAIAINQFNIHPVANKITNADKGRVPLMNSERSDVTRSDATLRRRVLLVFCFGRV